MAQVARGGSSWEGGPEGRRDGITLVPLKPCRKEGWSSHCKHCGVVGDGSCCPVLAAASEKEGRVLPPWPGPWGSASARGFWGVEAEASSGVHQGTLLWGAGSVGAWG